jgi:hypothetical protein
MQQIVLFALKKNPKNISKECPWIKDKFTLKKQDCRTISILPFSLKEDSKWKKHFT